MDQQLKQRLIGVTIIVSLVVIFVPMLFDKADQQPGTASDGVPPVPEAFQEQAIELPRSAEDVAPKDTGSVSESGYKIIPLTEEAPQKPAEAAQAKAIPAEAEPVEAPMEEEQFEPAPEKPLRPAEKLREEPFKSLAEPVQKPGKAEPAEKKAKEAKKAKVQVQTAPVKPKAVAPAKKAEATARAEPSSAKSERTKPESAEVAARTLAPQKPAPESSIAQPPSRTEPAGGLDAWVVQTGSFTTESKARALAEKLRQAKFTAFVEAVPGKTGSLYRVQVGPALERARAEQMQKQIETNLGIRGIIIPHR
jgi:DedD protein